MKLGRSLFIYALIALLVGAILQSGESLVLAGVKPNLVLMLLAVFSLFTLHFFPYAMLAVAGAFFLDFTPGVTWESAALVGVALIFFYVRSRFIAAGLLATLVFSVFGTVLFYLLISPSLLYDGMTVLVKELIYNGLVAVALFAVTGFIYEKKGGPAIR